MKLAQKYKFNIFYHLTKQPRANLMNRLENNGDRSPGQTRNQDISSDCFLVL